MDWKNVMQFNKFAAVDALALSPSHQLLQRHVLVTSTSSSVKLFVTVHLPVHF